MKRILNGKAIIAAGLTLASLATGLAFASSRVTSLDLKLESKYVENFGKILLAPAGSGKVNLTHDQNTCTVSETSGKVIGCTKVKYHPKEFSLTKQDVRHTRHGVAVYYDIGDRYELQVFHNFVSDSVHISILDNKADGKREYMDMQPTYSLNESLLEAKE